MAEEHLRRSRRVRWANNPPNGHPSGWVVAIYDCLERFLLHLVLLGLVILVLFQVLQTQAVIRQLLNPLERIEGQDPGVWHPAPGAWSTGTARTGPQQGAPQPTPQGAPQAAPDQAAPPTVAAPAVAPVRQGQVTVVLLSRPAANAELLVGRSPAGDFRSGRVSATVIPGQDLAVDGRQVADSLTFRIVGLEGVTEPALGAQVTTQSDIRSFGIVRVP